MRGSRSRTGGSISSVAGGLLLLSAADRCLNTATNRSMRSGRSGFSFKALTSVRDALFSDTDRALGHIAAPRDPCAEEPKRARDTPAFTLVLTTAPLPPPHPP